MSSSCSPAQGLQQGACRPQNARRCAREVRRRRERQGGGRRPPARGPETVYSRPARGEERPVYFTENAPAGFGAEEFGFYQRARKTPGSRGRQLRLNGDLIKLFRDIESQSQHRDGWTIWHRNGVLLKMAQPLTHAVQIQPSRALAERHRPDLERLSAHYHGLLGRIGTLVQYQRFGEDGLLEWTEAAQDMIDHTVDKRDHAALYELRGRIMVRKGQLPEARASLQRAVSIYPHARNGAVFQLMSLHALLDERAEYLSLRSRFFAGGRLPAAVRELDRQMQVLAASPGP